jgi:5-methylcytosine-specific restriction endonuclease McrA
VSAAEAVVILILGPYLAVSGLLRWGPSRWAMLVPRTLRREYRWSMQRGGLLRKPRNRQQQGTGQFPDKMREAIFAADRQRCLYCGVRRGQLLGDGSRVRLNADHGIPWIQGGLTCPWNGFALCSTHNLVKRAYYKDRDGRVWGRLWGRNLHEAEKIRNAELAARLSPFRLARLLLAVSALAGHSPAAPPTSRRSPGRRSRRGARASRGRGRAGRAPARH